MCIFRLTKHQRCLLRLGKPANICSEEEGQSLLRQRAHGPRASRLAVRSGPKPSWLAVPFMGPAPIASLNPRSVTSPVPVGSLCAHEPSPHRFSHSRAQSLSPLSLTGPVPIASLTPRSLTGPVPIASYSRAQSLSPLTHGPSPYRLSLTGPVPIASHSRAQSLSPLSLHVHSRAQSLSPLSLTGPVPVGSLTLRPTVWAGRISRER